MEEIWKDIPEYEGIYQASSLGNIKSLNFKRMGKDKNLKLSLTDGGYLVVNLYKNGKCRNQQVHQLVAITFLNHVPCGHKLVVNHINFIKTDNYLENLEIITQRDNANQKHLKSSSGYTGVFWDKKVKKWASRINIGDNQKHLGYFSNEKEASQYYEDAALAIKEGLEIRIKRRAESSKYKGVTWQKKAKKWRAYIKLEGREKHIGLFKTEIEAHYAVESALKTQTE